MILIRPIGERDPRTVPGGSVKPKVLGRKLESKGGFLLGVAMNRPVPVLVSSVLVGNVRRPLTVYFFILRYMVHANLNTIFFLSL